jgi:diamine N-acetyltransferase
MPNLTLYQVARAPGFIHYRVSLQTAGKVIFCPLLAEDIDVLADFLSSLGPETRRFWQRERFDRVAARELCEAIARYDKLRLVAVPAGKPRRILALYEFSFSLPPGDLKRYASYGIPLDESMDCRFGPCVRDELQGSGLASALMPPVFEIARRFGKQRILLWGGVLTANQRAVRFYAKHGFETVGQFTNSDGNPCLDMLLRLPSGGQIG